MCSPRSTHAIALGLVVAALAPATALARGDLRSPDARDPFVARAAITRDLRSPDARDAAAGRSAAGSPSVLVVRVPQHRSAGDGGIDWGDASIGAGAALAVLALTAGGALVLQRRRHVTSARTPAAA
jgi:hypothetical protein